MGIEWVGSLGGPVIVVPVSALGGWKGGDGDEEEDGDDYDRACAVDGLAGVIRVGRTTALVLADEPADTFFLADHRAFVRWLAADSVEQLTAAAHELLADPTADWDNCGVWETDGPAVLMDSAFVGSELDEDLGDGSRPAHAPVPLPAGRWRVQAVQQVDKGPAWVGLVRLLPED